MTERATPPQASSKHIVDELIEERAERIRNTPFWPLVKALVYPMLRYKAARTMADTVADMSGVGVFDYLSNLLTLDVTVSGTEHIPRDGAFIVIANHPSGIADGIAVYDAMKTIRPDICYFANRDAVRVNDALHDIIIPVEWVEEKRSRAKTRETLIYSKQAFQAGRPVVIFPSGRLAYLTLSGLKERSWQATTINLMRRYKVPLVPLNIKGRNSLLYYTFHFMNDELRNMTLFNELLNKRGKHYDLAFGPMIRPETVTGDPQTAVARLQSYVEIGLRQGNNWL